MSKQVVLLGHPVMHSLAEVLQNAAFAALAIDARYVPIDTPIIDLPDAVERLRGDDDLLGAALTRPHKERVVPMVDRLTEEAQATGAVDTITRDGDRLVGHNTDVLGFRPALDALVGGGKMPKAAVVLGAGGGARAAVYSLISAGFLSVVVFNRHLHRGERLVKHFGRSASHMELRARPWHDSVIEAELAKADILVHASSVGREEDESPVPAELLPPDLRVLDLLVVPKETKLLRDAREAGAAEAQNGDLMLLNQSAAAFELWTGQQAPMDALRKQLDASRDAPEVPVEPEAEAPAGDSGADAPAGDGDGDALAAAPGDASPHRADGQDGDGAASDADPTITDAAAEDASSTEHGGLSTTGPGAVGERERTFAIEAVAAASRICRRVRADFDPSDATSKADASPVTVADLAAQAVVRMRMAEALPEDTLMGEEDAGPLRADPALAAVVLARVREERAEVTLDDVLAALDDCDDAGGPDRRWWTLDPVDGTKGFIRNEQYAVALGLIDDGEVVLAVMGTPNLPHAGVDDAAANGSSGRGCLFLAERGRGARQLPLEAPTDASAWRPIHVASVTTTAEARYAESVEAGHSDQGGAAAVAAALEITAAPLRLDSQAKYAVVARGDASVYLRLPRGDYRENVWDHAAGLLIVTEAGGRVSDVDGRDLDLTTGQRMTGNRGIIATAAPIHDAVVAAVRAELRSEVPNTA